MKINRQYWSSDMNPKINKILIVLLIVQMNLLSSCKDDNLDLSACGIDNPTQNISWLRNLIEGIYSEGSQELTSIKLYEYKSNEIIIANWRNIGIYDVPTGAIFSCDGELLYNCGGNQLIDSCTYVINKSIYLGRLLKE